MNRSFAAIRRAALLVLGTLVFAGAAQAQATRTWVSGVGDDVNPCSRTAPCKTYAGAISKTARGGIISTLDPGGFGAVTITKSITIEGTGTNGSILHSGTNGVLINITDPNDIAKNVVLRDIGIDGAGTTLGLNGVRVINANSVTLQNVTIKNVSSHGIDIAPSANARIAATNVLIQNAGGAGVHVAPTAGATSVDLDHLVFQGGLRGVWVKTRGSVTVRDSMISGATSVGLEAYSVGGSPAKLFIVDSTIANNSNGVLAQGPLGSVTLSGNTITGNGVNGLWQVSGVFNTYQDNNVFGNGNDTIPPATALLKR